MNVIQGGPTPVVTAPPEALGAKPEADLKIPFVPVKAPPKSEASGKYTVGRDVQNDLSASTRGRRVDIEA